MMWCRLHLTRSLHTLDCCTKMDGLSFMERTNDTHCDPCLMDPFPFYPLFLVLPALFDIPVKCFFFWIQSSSPLTEKTDVLTMSIVFVDFLLALYAVTTVLSLVLKSAFYNYAWSLLVGVLSFGHPLFHSLICVERYLAVERPLVFLKYRPLRYRFAVLAVAGMCTVAVKAIIMGLCGTDPFFFDAYLNLNCVFLIVILCVNSFSCLSILRALVRPSPGDKTLKSRNGKGKKDSSNIKRNAFFVVSTVQINMFIIYLPPIGLFLTKSWRMASWSCSVFLFNVWYILTLSNMHTIWFLFNTGKLRLRLK